MNEADTLTDMACSKLIDVNSTALSTANLSSSDSLNENGVMSASSTRSLELDNLTQELNLNSDLFKQTSELVQALAEAQKILQQQKEKIESLTAQLESSKAIQARLEREFAFNQQRYNEQSYQLIQAENACRDLRTCLNKHYSLPFNLDGENYARQPIPPWSKLSVSHADVASLAPSIELPAIIQESIALPGDSETEAQCQHLLALLEANSEITVDSIAEVSPHPTQSNEQVSINQTEELQLPQIQVNDTNWLSPVVYPSRPPKGRKSFAAVELPTF